MIYETSFNLRDNVEIISLKISGVIKSIWINNRGIEYQVRYFSDNEAKTVYFFKEELKLIEPSGKTIRFAG